MENQKIKFPIAAIFFFIYAIIRILGLVTDLVGYGFSIYSGVHVISLIGTILYIASCIFIGIVLLRKKLDTVLFVSTIPFVVISFIYLIAFFAPHNAFFRILDLIAYALLMLIVGTATIQPLAKFKSTAKMLFFLPAALMALNTIIDLVRYYIDEWNSSYNSFSNILLITLSSFVLPLILNTLPVFFLAMWCMYPYDTKQTYAPPGAYGVAQSPYDDGYCGLGKHIVLCLFTFGIWPLIWIYRTTRFLNKTPGAEQYDPACKLLLCMFIPFYNIYWLYKHGQRIDMYSRAKGIINSDMATMCLILGIFFPLIAVILMQDKINTICMTKSEDAAEAPAAENAAAYQQNTWSQQPNDWSQPSNDWSQQQNDRTQPLNDWSQQQNDRTQPLNDWAQQQNDRTQPLNDWSQQQNDRTQQLNDRSQPSNDWEQPSNDRTQQPNNWSQPSSFWSQQQNDWSQH